MHHRAPENGTPIGERRIDDEEAMQQLGEELARCAGVDGCLLLVGDLGSGKTTFTKGVARALGVPVEQVLSPTYTLINEYSAAAASEPEEPAMIHIDLYRLEEDDLFELGLDELLAGPGMKVIEWAERLPEPPENAIWIGLEITGEGSRRVRAVRLGTDDPRARRKSP